MVGLLRNIDKYGGAALVFVLSLFRNKSKGKGVPGKGKFLVIKLWALGDSVISLSLIRGIKTHFPNCQVDVLTRDRVKDVFECFPVDTIYSMDCLADWRKLVSQYNGYDMVFDCEPYFNISAVIAFFLSKERVGFSHQFRSRLYTKTVRFRKDRHMVQNYLEMLRVNGVSYDTRFLEPLRVGVQHTFRPQEFLSRHSGEHDILVGISPGVGRSAKNRMWFEDRYAALADRLMEELNCRVVFIDSEANRDVVERIISLMVHDPLHAAGRFTLKEVFFLISRCGIFIGNDSGLMHVAAAQECNTIGLFGPNTPVLWAPWGHNNVSVYKTKLKPAVENDKGVFKKGNRTGYMGPIAVDHVFQQVKNLL